MSLHDRIMGQLPDILADGDHEYYNGFAEASGKAAQLAKEADELMEEMASALRVAAMSKDPDIGPDAYSVAMKYNAWKEQNQ